MYAIYAYIGVVLGVNVGIYGIHGVSGDVHMYSVRVLKFSFWRMTWFDTKTNSLCSRLLEAANADGQTNNSRKAGDHGEGHRESQIQVRLKPCDLRNAPDHSGPDGRHDDAQRCEALFPLDSEIDEQGQGGGDKNAKEMAEDIVHDVGAVMIPNDSLLQRRG